MFVRHHQDATQVYQGFAIQLQGLYGRPSNSGQTKNLRSIVRPCEMVRPAVPPRIKQHDRFA
jgi:hypothetical protein